VVRTCSCDDPLDSDLPFDELFGVRDRAREGAVIGRVAYFEAVDVLESGTFGTLGMIRLGPRLDVFLRKSIDGIWIRSNVVMLIVQIKNINTKKQKLDGRMGPTFDGEYCEGQDPACCLPITLRFSALRVSGAPSYYPQVRDPAWHVQGNHK
jgi:hypothetical protein